MPGKIRQLISMSALLVTALLAGSVQAASVKPLEVLSERIVVLEVERLANDHTISAALVRRSLDRLNKGMNIMSKERSVESLKLLNDARQAVSGAEKSAAALSGYIAAIRPQLKEGGHERFLPLAGFYQQIEKPYHVTLAQFLATATDFVQYCSENLEAITTGRQAESVRYNALYGAYLRDMEEFNQQSVKRSQLLADWATEYPQIMELLPR